jgi:sugar lactone lactonase YvrE
MLKKSFYVAGFLILALSCLAYSQVLRQPESAVYDQPRERYLISNYYDGQIIAIDKNGIQSVFAEGKNSSAGLHIIDDTVYVGCGGEGVLAYNLVTGEEVMDILIPGSILLNDVTSDTSGNLYVSDPYGNKIYKIQLSDRSHSVLVNYEYWPNGLLFDKKLNRLLGCTSTTRKICSIDMNDGSMTELVNVWTGHLDGLAEDNAGNIYVSSQGPEAVYRYNSDFTSVRELVSSGHNGPADIYYNKWLEVLVVPNIAGNTVDFIDMPIPPSLITYNFSDEIYGDGDGILEGGEEIELTFSFENIRPGPMVNTSANLYCQDILITITNGNVDLGDLASEEIVDNNSSPMRFTIPADYKPRIDSFYIEFAYSFMGSEKMDYATILQAVGSPEILLVDDFAGEGIADYYIEALEGLSLLFTLWDIQTMGTPLSDDLNEYAVVIWFTGNSGADSIDNDQILSLQGYMDNGGNLFMTGQEIAANINSLDVNFLHDYLRCEHVEPYYLSRLNTVSTGQVFAEGDTLEISGGDGASNQIDTDHISALNGGVAELNYVTTEKCGAVSYAGDYKLVFFGFGFEAIRSDLSRFYPRTSTLLNILDFFEFDYPNVAPVASNLTVAPGDLTHMTNHTPEISWMYSDEETTPQAYYQIQLGNDDDWFASEMWDSGPVSGSEVSDVYSGSELIDGEDYYLRVRVCDGSLWSNWVYGAFHMNSVPVPVDLTPNNLEETDVNPPVLSHACIPDIEGDPLTYDYQLYDDIEMTVLLHDDSGLVSDPGERIYWPIDTTLNENEDYYWQARSRDNYETGAWSELASFMLIPAYICGDANGDKNINVGDAVFLVNLIFHDGPMPIQEEAGNVNCDTGINVGDAVYLVNYIFQEGAPDPCASCP